MEKYVDIIMYKLYAYIISGGLMIDDNLKVQATQQSIMLFS